MFDVVEPSKQVQEDKSIPQAKPTEVESKTIPLTADEKMQKAFKALPPPAEDKKKKEFINDPSRNLIQLQLVQDAYSLTRIKGMGDYKTGTWKRLTLAIANACGNEGKPIWEYISKKEMASFNQVHNDKIWDECLAMKQGKKPLSIGSLMAWAKEDNLELYNSCFNKGNIDWNRLTHYTFGLALEKRFLGDSEQSKIIFTGEQKQSTAYLFNGVYWKELGLNNAEIKKEHFNALYNHYSAEFAKVADGFDEKTQYNIRQSILNLDNVKF